MKLLMNLETQETKYIRKQCDLSLVYLGELSSLHWLSNKAVYFAAIICVLLCVGIESEHFHVVCLDFIVKCIG